MNLELERQVLLVIDAVFIFVFSHRYHHTVHLFTRLFSWPGLHPNTRSNSAKFDVEPSTLNEQSLLMLSSAILGYGEST